MARLVLHVGDDHNLLSNRSNGDPHPQYVRRSEQGTVVGPLDLEPPVVINDAGLPFDPVFRVETDNLDHAFYIDGVTDTVTVLGDRIAPSPTAGGMFQVVDTSTTPKPGTTQTGKSMFLSSQHAIAGSGSNEFGLYRGLHMDFDYGINIGAGDLIINQIRPVEFDIDIGYTAGITIGSEQVVPFKLEADINPQWKVGQTGSPSSAIIYKVVHNTTVGSRVPVDGYINYFVGVEPGTAVPVGVVGVRQQMQVKASGATNQAVCFQAFQIPVAGHTAQQVGYSASIRPISTAAAIKYYQASEIALGSRPSADVILSFFGPDHIMTNSSVIAAGGSTPSATSPTHLSFTDGSRNLYAEDNLEVDGTSWLDGALVFNDTAADVDARFESQGQTHMLFLDASTNRLGVANSSPLSALDGLRSFGWTITEVAVNTTLNETHFCVLVDASGGGRTITLPAASGCTRRIYIIKKIDSSSNAVTIDGNASETIDGATTRGLLTQYASVIIQCDGTEWWVIG